MPVLFIPYLINAKFIKTPVPYVYIFEVLVTNTVASHYGCFPVYYEPDTYDTGYCLLKRTGFNPAFWKYTELKSGLGMQLCNFTLQRACFHAHSCDNRTGSIICVSFSILQNLELDTDLKLDPKTGSRTVELELIR